MAQHPPSWNWHDDRQWARSRLVKNGDKWFDVPTSRVFTFELEVRSDFSEAGTKRLGEIFLKQHRDTGELTISIREETYS